MLASLKKGDSKKASPSLLLSIWEKALKGMIDIEMPSQTSVIWCNLFVFILEL
jgi:hypothetical protein